MTSPQWVNIEDDGAVHALLDRLATQLPVESIDSLWLFSTRRASGVESTVVVISAFDADHVERRRVGAVRWLVTRDRRGRPTVSEEIYEYATAPADAIQRVVDGVMRRLGDDTRDPPRAIELAGNTDAWDELLRELGAPSRETAETARDAVAEADAAAARDDNSPADVVHVGSDPTDAGTEPG